MFSKFCRKPAQKGSIFSSKANNARRLLFILIIMSCSSIFALNQHENSSTEFFNHELEESIYRNVAHKWAQALLKLEVGSSFDELLPEFLEHIHNKTLASYYFKKLVRAAEILSTMGSSTRNYYLSSRSISAKLIYSYDRVILHEEIIEHFMERIRSHQENGTPQLIILMGGSGTGKSYYKDTILFKKSELISSMSTDEVREMIPEYSIGIDLKSRKIASIVHDECLDINKMILERIFLNKFSFIYESTGADISYSKWLIETAKGLGYATSLVLIDADLENAIERVKWREDGTGRHVPLSVIERSNRFARKNFIRLLPFVDEWTLVDNNRDAPRIVWEKQALHFPLCFDYHYVSNFLEKINDEHLLTKSIRQIQNLEEIFSVIDSNCLVVLEVDDTLILAKEAIGRDIGCSYILKKIEELQIENDAEANRLSNCLNPLMDAIHHYPGEAAVDLVPYILTKGAKIIGLTSRPMKKRGIEDFAEKTFDQLGKCAIFFPPHALLDNRYPLKLLGGAYFYKGIIFSGSIPKGESLIELFKLIRYFPKKVIFVDNKMRNIESVVSSCQQEEIEVIGFHYVKTSEEEPRKSQEIAWMQLLRFAEEGILFSDDEVLILKKPAK